MFYLCLFIEGDLTSLANSHFFNISSKVEVSSSSSSTTTGAATITTGSTALGIPIPTTSIYSSSPTTMAATFVASSDTSTGMSTGIKAAIGVGASAAGIFIVGFAWFCITRQRSKPSPLPPKDFVDLPILHSLYGEREKRTLDSDHKQSSVYELSSNPYYPPPRFEFPAIS
ncbi:uncharacterized protein N7529_006140 [Penicillium soppii]|uniref:uncharacterized protein n=1 Tax=Penicillium soppii TaxID=69789 RepID=UPI00254844C7|nr:uncharacterized protein N7529_006140 [Penicillium soppii]KAJ5864224.1 hypothetical protein N7529_006140 [Penicillium soppii]